MDEIILCKYGEMALKGLNKNSFESVLLKNIKRRLKDLGEFKIYSAQSTIYIEPLNDFFDIDEAFSRLQKVFGLAALCRAKKLPKDFDEICKQSLPYLKEKLSGYKTFKVESKRSDKTFPLNSMELSKQFGGFINQRFKELSVDVKNPEVVVRLEIRDFAAFVHAENIKGAGGLPVGTSGKAMLLLSGGIDSPVAAYMMAKRGIIINCIHFMSPPYTSDRALLKVEHLCERLVPYCGTINFYAVHFTEIQEAIKKYCPEEFFTVIMRRMMMRIASKVAEKNDCLALITGESVAQVASQTLGAIRCTDAVCTLPVFRPVAGLDKVEIVEIAQKIDTFDISIEPYEDCCTVFTPRHPKTNPSLEAIEKAESKFDFEPLIEKAVETVSYKYF